MTDITFPALGLADPLLHTLEARGHHGHREIKPRLPCAVSLLFLKHYFEITPLITLQFFPYRPGFNEGVTEEDAFVFADDLEDFAAKAGYMVGPEDELYQSVNVAMVDPTESPDFYLEMNAQDPVGVNLDDAYTLAEQDEANFL